jgi:hypothetical protein
MSDEVEKLKAEVAQLKERIEELECDRSVLILQNEALDKLRRQDVVRLARRGLEN